MKERAISCVIHKVQVGRYSQHGRILKGSQLSLRNRVPFALCTAFFTALLWQTCHAYTLFQTSIDLLIIDAAQIGIVELTVVEPTAGRTGFNHEGTGRIVRSLKGDWKGTVTFGLNRFTGTVPISVGDRYLVFRDTETLDLTVIGLSQLSSLTHSETAMTFDFRILETETQIMQYVERRLASIVDTESRTGIHARVERFGLLIPSDLSARNSTQLMVPTDSSTRMLLLQMAESTDPLRRLIAARSLYHYQDSKSIHALFDLANDDESQIRSYAEQSLNNLNLKPPRFRKATSLLIMLACIAMFLGGRMLYKRKPQYSLRDLLGAAAIGGMALVVLRML